MLTFILIESSVITNNLLLNYIKEKRYRMMKGSQVESKFKYMLGIIDICTH